jgi:hypothetical protein
MGLRLTQPEQVYVGWRYAQLHEDPGPPPQRPPAPEPEALDLERLAARRRAVNLMNRPAKGAAICAVVAACVFLASWAGHVMPGEFAGFALLACLAVVGILGYPIWQAERAIRTRVKEERQRISRMREARRRRIVAEAEQHRVEYENWVRLRQVYDGQREWYPVAVPAGVDRVDVAGGTLAGWSAAVTMMGVARLAAGSQVTVVDLSEGAVAGDLVALAAERGEDPLVWVLPADLPRLDLTRNLGPEALADVLSLVVNAGEEPRDLSVDNALLERILSVFDGTARIPQVTAALRALAQVGDPRDDLRRGLITDDQLDRVSVLFGRGAADKVVIERAWAMEAQLRKLEPVGTDPVRLPPAGLHVLSMDRRAGVLSNRVLGTYVVTSLTHALRTAPAARKWDHTLFLCGADRLRGDVLDRLIDACEATGTGLVLLYRSIPVHVKERLGRGHAAVGFMRLGNAEDARIAAEHLGADHRLVVAEVTETASVTRPDDPYSSTVAYARRTDQPLTDPIALPVPRPPRVGSELLGRAATAWAHSVWPSGERHRSREVVVEQQQLQELPPTAMVFSHTTEQGRRVQLIDANPGIMALPTAEAGELGPIPQPRSSGRHAKPS